MTQGSVSGPYLCNVFLSELNIFTMTFPALFKYTDDSFVIAPARSNSNTPEALVELFLNWSEEYICHLPAVCMTEGTVCLSTDRPRPVKYVSIFLKVKRDVHA